MDISISRRYASGRETVKEIANDYSNCHRIPTSDIFLKDNETKVWVLDSLDCLYIDDDHLSYAGAKKLKERFSKAIGFYTN